MHITTRAALAALLLASTASLSHAASFSFQTIDNPADPTFNQLLGINDSGTIAGYYGSGAAGHPNQGYTIAAPYTTFVPDNAPTSVQTQATGINKTGATPGFWSPTNLGGGDANYGFIRWNAKHSYKYLNVNNPATTSNPPVNQLLGMNNHNLAAGFYNDADGNPHGYVYAVAQNAFTAVNIPGAVSDAATGINDKNLISGFFTDTHGRTVGFEMPLTGGKPIRFGVKGSPVTQLLGINNKGMSAGFYVDGQGIPHGLLYNPANGEWQQIDDPNGVNGTVVNGLNNKNQLVGFYMDADGNTHGMLVSVSK